MTDVLPEVPRERLRTSARYWVAERKIAVFAWSLIAILCVGGLGAYQAGAVDPIGIKNPRTSFGTEGANLVEVGGLGPDVEVGAVGSDLTRTYIIRAKGVAGPQPAVIFLHGFGSMLVVGYEPWIEHLAREGITVIFPTWQQPPFPTDGSQNPRTNMFDGVKLAVKAVPIKENQVAVLGFSAGAALGFDYAALAKSAGAPAAGLVYSIFPGRAFPGEKKAILPIPSVADMPKNTLVDSLVSRKDDEAGTRWGIQQYKALRGRGSELRKLTYITTPGLTDHFAPGKADSKARYTFWVPFDRELTEHLGVQRIPDQAIRDAVHQTTIVNHKIHAESLFRKKAYKGTTQVEGGALNGDGAQANPGAAGAK